MGLSVGNNMSNFTQQTFIGASIASYNISLGLNEQTTQLSINLVEDLENSDLFTPPPIGAPIYFSHTDDVGTFTYGGIFQHYVAAGGQGGSPLYEVTVLDPRILLDGIQVILDSYTGATQAVPNLINVFGYLESQQFGNALANDGGVPFIKILQALNDLVSASSVLSSSAYGGPYIKFRSYSYSLDLSEMPTVSPYYRVPGNFISLLELITIVCQDHAHDFYCILTESALSNIIKIKTIDRRRQAQTGQLGNYIASIDGVIAKEVGQELRTDPTSMFLVGGQVQELFITTQQFYDSFNNRLNTFFDGGVVVYEADPDHYYYTIQPNGDLLETIITAGINSTTNLGTFDSAGFLYDSVNHAAYFIAGDGVLTYISDNGDSEIIGTCVLSGLSNLDRTKTTILPFWGLDAVGNVVIADVSDRFSAATFNIDSRHWSVIGIGPTYSITMAEIRAALISQDMWESKILELDPVKAQRIGIDGTYLDVNGAFLDLVTKDQGRTNVSKLNVNSRILDANAFEFGNIEENVFKLYSYIKEFAEQHYGRQFMVRIPDVSVTRESETNVLVFSLEVTDGGFLEDGATPLDLPNYFSDLFTDQDGKFQAFVRLDNIQNYDLSNMTPGQDYVVVNKNYPGGISVPYYAFIKCNVDPNLVFLNYNSLTSPRVIITLPAPVFMNIDKQVRSINLGLKQAWLKYFMNTGLTRQQYEDDFYITNNLARPTTLQDGTPIQPELDVFFTLDDRLPNIYLFTESDNDYATRLATNPNAIRYSNTLAERLQEQVTNVANGLENDESAPYFKIPDFVAIPLKDNTNTYGPWYSNAAIGKVRFEQDESLTPWNYGGFSQMNLAATAKLVAGTASSLVIEAGSITVPGVPTLGIGTTIKYGGPNITGISVSIGEQGVTTTYSMQTYTPRFGSLAQQNAARFTRLTKQSQDLKRKVNKIIRAPSRQQINRRGNARFIGLDGSKILTAKSPHPAILARNDIGISGNITGSSVAILTLGEGVAGVDGNNKAHYQSTALMSLDGIFRPFTTASGNDGSHGYMPHFEKPTSSATSPTVFNLNPFASGNIYSVGIPTNTDIGYVLSGDDYTIRDQLYSQNAIPSSIRGVGLRAPLVMVGWGYDTNGKPVPNSNPNNPTDNFAQNYRTDSREWKAGPLDARWDNDRKVWVAAGDSLSLYVVIAHSGNFVGERPRYVVRPITNITTSGGRLTYENYTLPSSLPMELSSDKFVFNMQEAFGDIHTVGIGSPVILYNKFGKMFFNELPRTFARKSDY